MCVFRHGSLKLLEKIVNKVRDNVINIDIASCEQFTEVRYNGSEI